MAPSTGSVSSIASRAQSHLPRPSTSRIDVLFGLYVTTMAGVACYCAYNFYKAYQVW